MSGERPWLTAEWLISTREALRDREERIVAGVLQQPDYPPLPECPACHVAPEQITTRLDGPVFGRKDMPTLVDYSPCGHGFRISEAEIACA